MMENDYKTELLKNNAIAFVPGGNSMWPIIKHRKQTVIVEVKKQRLKRYDVALYERKNGAFVLHRVMETKDFGYIICGDSQFSLERVEEEQVFGVLSGFYKGKRYISVEDEKYKDKVEKWYKRKLRRKIRLKLFYQRVRIKNILSRIGRKIFGRKSDNQPDTDEV